MSRATLNLSMGDLDAIARLSDAQRQIGEIADALLYERTSRRGRREDFGRRLNAIKASIRTVEIHVGKGEEER
jgi:hypothetical protein